MRPRTIAVLALLAFAIAAITWWLFGSRAANVLVTEHAEAELVAARDAAEPGRPLLVALRLKAKPGWHTYWRNPGDSGQPTSIEWRLPAGFSAGAIRWPVPQRFPVGPLVNYGYEGEVLLASELRVPADAKGTLQLAVRARWLVCNPEHCIPESGDLALALPAGSAGPGKWGEAFAAIRLPGAPPAQWKLSARREATRVLLELDGAQERSLTFFPNEEGKVQHAAAQPLEPTGTGVRLAIPVSQQPVGEFVRLAGVIVTADARAFEIDIPITAAPH